VDMVVVLIVVQSIVMVIMKKSLTLAHLVGHTMNFVLSGNVNGSLGSSSQIVSAIAMSTSVHRT